MNVDLKVAQLLVSRVCHDLAGGVGALSTGAELLVEEGGTADDAALTLIALSAKQTTSRLQFLRMAFGLGGGADGSPSTTTHDLHKLFSNYIEGGRIRIEWNPENVQIGLHEGKLLLNMCLIACEALPRGGVVEVNISDVEGRLGFGVAAKGDKAHLKPEFMSIITVQTDLERLTPRNIHGHFTAVLANKLGAELEIAVIGEDEIGLAALLPSI